MENNGGFNVVVNPNVYYAFIVALLMILGKNCHIYLNRQKQKKITKIDNSW